MTLIAVRDVALPTVSQLSALKADILTGEVRMIRLQDGRVANNTRIPIGEVFVLQVIFMEEASFTRP